LRTAKIPQKIKTQIKQTASQDFSIMARFRVLTGLHP
jgi:hypothetical protein